MKISIRHLKFLLLCILMLFILIFSSYAGIKVVGCSVELGKDVCCKNYNLGISGQATLCLGGPNGDANELPDLTYDSETGQVRYSYCVAESRPTSTSSSAKYNDRASVYQGAVNSCTDIAGVIF